MPVAFLHGAPDLGSPRAAEDVAAFARQAAAAIGFTEGLVKLRIVDRRDAAASMGLLDELENDPLIEHALQLRAKARAWRGWFLLRGGADADALDCLREAASLLKAGGLFLELPIVGVLLAEAEWRAGHEVAADRAADLALETSAPRAPTTYCSRSSPSSPPCVAP
ncbi:hypothetical protein BJ965_000057 [Streptomyces luteogriseus]|uniref:Uncharacterized protein n=1 Tax=Streptomyces luteogriseus TaxID=68233 RepID=A0A7W7DI69_9ACTN|nr:hypothetical protein [Streptomyces luteogriseus]MBB4710175.1 hypothetical protein [Streptomyces luteogriseus]